jgi:hypothetical protein
VLLTQPSEETALGSTRGITLVAGAVKRVTSASIFGRKPLSLGSSGSHLPPSLPTSEQPPSSSSSSPSTSLMLELQSHPFRPVEWDRESSRSGRKSDDGSRTGYIRQMSIRLSSLFKASEERRVSRSTTERRASRSTTEEQGRGAGDTPPVQALE